MTRNFNDLLAAKLAERKFVCVGLDSELGKIPKSVVRFAWRGDDRNEVSASRTILLFNEDIVEATCDIVGSYKPNLAFYLWHGAEGMTALHQTIADVHAIAPDVPVILDCKDMDIGNTNVGYVKMAFEYCKADAITVNPYLGGEAAKPFLDQKDKGVFVLCRTSNAGSDEFQGMDVVGDMVPGNYMPLYEYVAHRVANHWNTNRNCGLVVGANHPEELREVREIVGDMPILIPGVGAQGADVELAVKAGKNSLGQGVIFNVSRSVIFASNGLDFAEAARAEALRVHMLIHQYL